MKLRHVRVLEYVVDCEDAEQGLKYLDYHLAQRTVKDIYKHGPLTIREAVLGQFPEITKDNDNG